MLYLTALVLIAAAPKQTPAQTASSSYCRYNIGGTWVSATRSCIKVYTSGEHTWQQAHYKCVRAANSGWKGRLAVIPTEAVFNIIKPRVRNCWGVWFALVERFDRAPRKCYPCDNRAFPYKDDWEFRDGATRVAGFTWAPWGRVEVDDAIFNRPGGVEFRCMIFRAIDLSPSQFAGPKYNDGNCLSGYHVFFGRRMNVGVACEFLDINECLSNPCRNYGTCTDKSNGYTCQCRSPYYGPRCRKRDCVWGSWSSYGSCSRTCGGGTQTRRRSKKITALYGGRDCSGSATNTTSCNTHCCPIHCVWGTWGSFGVCSKTCGGGTKTRRRSKRITAKCGGRDCTGSYTDPESCNPNCCPIHCVWGTWGSWGVCSKTCGGGTKTRRRSKRITAQCGGRDCTGSYTKTDACNINSCSRPCSPNPCQNGGTCVQTGTSYSCRCLSPYYGPRCRKRDCVWGSWSSWGSCSRTCGGGTRTRRRTKKTPPANGGKDCTGSYTKTEPCNTNSCGCPWGAWGAWSHCSRTCGGGKRTRRRSLRQPCSGSDSQTSSCQTQSCRTGPRCGTKIYDTNTHVCCGGRLQRRSSTKNRCCGTITFNPSVHVCCAKKLSPISGSNNRCCGRYGYNPATSMCCGTRPINLATRKCCNGKSYNPSLYFCCNGVSVFRTSSRACCAGKKVYDPRSQMCCKNIVTTKSYKKDCCAGNTYYNPLTHMCCFNRTSAITSTKDCCAGNRHYNPQTQMCCKGKLTTINPIRKCCAGQRTYDPRYFMCYRGRVSKKSSSLDCCGGETKYNPKTQFCCKRRVNTKTPTKDCCAETTIYNPQTHICCNQRISQGSATKACCGGTTIYNPLSKLCCRGKLSSKSISKECCAGTKAYNPGYQTCCRGTVSKKSLYKRCCAGTTSYNPATQLCCGGKVSGKTVTRQCCAGKIYNPKTHKCACGTSRL